MKTPLIDGLKKYIDEKNIRMHMPGHKGKDELSTLTSLIPEIDLTEVKGVDNLQNPKSIIKASQENASKAFGALETLFSVNGTTSGIYASIISQTSRGGTVLMQRDSHKSVYQALVLGDLNASYVYPRYDERENILLGITPRDIENSLVSNPEIEIVVVTYPTYYGVCSDLKEIIDTVHAFKKIVVVDEAHGSHLTFNSRLPKSALSLGADIVIQSTHKTLPAFTQSSMVHVGTRDVDIEKLKTQMNVFQTTSPSYILMSSLDYAVDFAERFGEEKLDELLDKIEEIKCALRRLENVRVFDGLGGVKDSNSEICDFDPTKLLIRVDSLSGVELESILREEYHIQVEMSDSYYVLALTTMMDDLSDLDKLKDALEDLSSRVYENSKTYNKTGNKRLDSSDSYEKLKTILPSHKAFYSDKISVQLSKAVGKVAGEFIIPYPPGIPLVVPGEELTRDVITQIQSLKDSGIELLSTDSDLREIVVIDSKNE